MAAETASELHVRRVAKALEVEALGWAAHSPNGYYVQWEACLDMKHKLEGPSATYHNPALFVLVQSVKL